MINSVLLSDIPLLPDGATMSAPYCALQRKAPSLMFDHWRSFSPVPAYYTFPLSLSPHPFMGLGKFMAGRSHQMRVQKSYLAANASWLIYRPPSSAPCAETNTRGLATPFSVPGQGSCPALPPPRRCLGCPGFPPLVLPPRPPHPGLLHQGHRHQLPPGHAPRTTSLPSLDRLSLLPHGPTSDGTLRVLAASPLLRSSHMEDMQLFLTLAEWLFNLYCCCPFLW